MNTSDSSYGSGTGKTLAAVFPDRDAAKTALTNLHESGYRNVWLGVTHGDGSTGATIASEPTTRGVGNSLGRFFSGEGAQEEALHQALIAHGLGDDQARRLEATVPSGAAIVIVDGENDVDEAADILQLNGGTIADDLTTSATQTGSTTRTAYENTDKNRRLQLREERLLIDKQRVASGEARIRKEVISEQQSIDVPVFHEVLFVQRRPVADGGTPTTTPIGQDEVIRVPLTEERVDVSKRTVVTEEVDIGTRRVEGTEHVSDTVRREELRVDDDTTGAEPPLRGR